MKLIQNHFRKVPRTSLSDSQSIFPVCSIRVIRGQPGTSLRYPLLATRPKNYNFLSCISHFSLALTVQKIHRFHPSILYTYKEDQFKNYCKRMKRAGERLHARSRTSGSKNEVFDEKMMFPNFVQDHSRKVPRGPEH